MIPAPNVVPPPTIVDPAPLSRPGLLSNPRSPTTTQPIRSLRDVGGRHRRLFPRFADRGGFRPVLGFARRLPDGDLGGIPRGVFYRGELEPAVRRSPVERVTETAGAYGAFTRRRLWALRGAPDARGRIKVEPGISALEVARAPRWTPGTPSGFQGGLRDLFRARVGQRGVFYGETRTPRSKWLELMGDRVLGWDRIRAGVSGSSVRATVPGADSTAGDGAIARSVETSIPVGAGLRTELADTPSNGGNGAGAGNLLGLVAVVAVGWLLLR